MHNIYQTKNKLSASYFPMDGVNIQFLTNTSDIKEFIFSLSFFLKFAMVCIFILHLPMAMPQPLPCLTFNGILIMLPIGERKAFHPFYESCNAKNSFVMKNA